MARIQVLPLPTKKFGPVERTPFVLIIGCASDDEFASFDDEFCDGLRARTGAAAVIVFGGEMTAENVDEALHQAAQGKLLEQFYPQRYVSAPPVESTVETGGQARADGAYLSNGSFLPSPKAL